eukprot:2239088-Ditylum_brightwellii.AAC.1
MQLLDDNKVLDILEYGVPAPWRREFTVQGFDPVDQGLRKFVEFCTHLESCEPSMDKPKDKKFPRSQTAGESKAKKKFYCNMHGHNKTHNTEVCFELKGYVKHAKLDEIRKDADKVTCKDLSAFINAKVTTASKRQRKI